MLTDSIADFLTRIRNGLMSKSKTVKVPQSKMLQWISEILKRKGFIEKFDIESHDNGRKFLIIYLRYDENNVSVIDKIVRVSKPGLRVYKNYKDIPRIRNGLGLAIVTTSKGVMTGGEAKKLRVGGEIVCYIW